MNDFKKDFPIFEKEFDLKKIIYLDSAATTLKPQKVIDRVIKFYEHETSNVSRGNHFLSEKNSQALEDVRSKTASFIKGKSKEIAFTLNSTDSINMIVNSLEFKEDDEVIISIIEHHSNYLPWNHIAKVKIINLKEDGTIDLDHLKSLITDKTKLISVTYASNVTGNIQPVDEIVKIAKEKNILTLIDAAQVVSHFPIDVKKIDCDFMTFSSHKMFGPSGVGILYVKNEIQHLLKPIKFGGGMANKVSLEEINYKSYPHLFETGTPNIEGILGFGAAIDYILEKGFDYIEKYLHSLEKYAREKLLELGFVDIFYISRNHLPIFSLITKNKKVNIGMISQMLSDSHNMIVRGGFHCCQLIYNQKGLSGGIRLSLHIYNTKDDVDKFIDVIKGFKAFFVNS